MHHVQRRELAIKRNQLKRVPRRRRRREDYPGPISCIVVNNAVPSAADRLHIVVVWSRAPAVVSHSRHKHNGAVAIDQHEALYVDTNCPAVEIKETIDP
jgi:hypothetical protein